MFCNRQNYQLFMNIGFIKFQPYLKSVLWGGDRIAEYKGIATDQKQIGESWEISGVTGRESVVSEGTDAGLTIVELIRKYKGALVGEEIYAKYGDTFPILVKFIDAKQDLSLQVHPDDTIAKNRHNCLGKTEMWYIIDTLDNAKINVGFTQSITPKEYEKRVANNTIMDVVACHDSHPGDLFYLPAGRIHSIGAGNLLAEIQRTCDITYRVYDFDRRDAQGNTRELHTQLAKTAIDYTVHDSYVTSCPCGTSGETKLVKCEYFDTSRIIIEGTYQLLSPCAQSFRILMCLKGDVEITDEKGNITTLRQGETVLVPANTQELQFNGNAELLTATAM